MLWFESHQRAPQFSLKRTPFVVCAVLYGHWSLYIYVGVHATIPVALRASPLQTGPAWPCVVSYSSRPLPPHDYAALPLPPWRWLPVGKIATGGSENMFVFTEALTHSLSD